MDKENPHEGHRNRMRERFINGDIDTFFPHEILEVILYASNKRKNTNDLAHRLMERFGSFSAVLDASVEELMQVDGIGEQSAVLLKTYPAVLRRYQADKLANKKRLKSFGDAMEFCRALLANCPNEEFVAILLNGDGDIITTKRWKGTVNRVKVMSREVVEHCVTAKATAVVVAHCHPNGSPSPSSDDILFTKMLYFALRCVDVTLTEHIIIGKSDYYSFSNEGNIERFKDDYYFQYNPLGVRDDEDKITQIFKKDR